MEHNDVRDINANWSSYFGTFTDVCNRAGAPVAATSVQRVFNLVLTGQFEGAITFHFELSSVYSRDAAAGLSQIFYQIMIYYVAKALWEFLNPTSTPPLDIYVNLKTILAEQLNNVNFISNGGLVYVTIGERFSVANALD